METVYNYFSTLYFDSIVTSIFRLLIFLAIVVFAVLIIIVKILLFIFGLKLLRNFILFHKVIICSHCQNCSYSKNWQRRKKGRFGGF